MQKRQDSKLKVMCLLQINCYKSISANKLATISAYHSVLTRCGPKMMPTQLETQILSFLEGFAAAIIQLHHFFADPQPHARDIVSSAPIAELSF